LIAPFVQSHATVVDFHYMGKSLLPNGFARPLSQNRRRGRRHLLDIPATLVGGVAPEELAVNIIELSKHGIGIQANKPLTSGEIYQVRAFDSLVPAGMHVKIISSRSSTDGEFIIGGEVV
jgi:hypothetical protein